MTSVTTFLRDTGKLCKHSISSKRMQVENSENITSLMTIKMQPLSQQSWPANWKMPQGSITDDALWICLPSLKKRLQVRLTHYSSSKPHKRATDLLLFPKSLQLTVMEIMHVPKNSTEDNEEKPDKCFFLRDPWEGWVWKENTEHTDLPWAEPPTFSEKHQDKFHNS